jgi:regulator of cell morphogenesis and NO signaling
MIDDRKQTAGLRTRIDPRRSVNELLQCHPATVMVLNDFGVDACCGGASSLAEAALAAGVEPVTLLEALEASLAPTGADRGTCSVMCACASSDRESAS